MKAITAAKAVLTIGILLSFSSTLNASAWYPFFRGMRAEGMGNADIAVVDDETSLFINPAGLGKNPWPLFFSAQYSGGGK